MRCFSSASISATSLPLSLSESIAAIVRATASDMALPLSSRGDSLMLSLIGVISATVRALVELDAVIRPLNGLSKAFSVLRKEGRK